MEVPTFNIVNGVLLATNDGTPDAAARVARTVVALLRVSEFPPPGTSKILTGTNTANGSGKGPYGNGTLARAAASRLASLRTTAGALAPSSKTQGLRCLAASAARMRPTQSLPVNWRYSN